MEIEKYKSAHSIDAVRKLEKLFRDNHIVLESYSHDGTVTSEGLVKFETICWIHPEDIEIYKKQS